MSKTLQDKLAALDQAVTLAQELDEPTLSAALAPAHDLLTRAGQRRALAPLSCVVALLEPPARASRACSTRSWVARSPRPPFAARRRRRRWPLFPHTGR